MGITGKTENKLFKVKTLNRQNPYQIGLNGVLDIVDGDDGVTKIIYEIDDIKYTTHLTNSGNEDNLTITKQSLGDKKILKDNTPQNSNTTLNFGKLVKVGNITNPNDKRVFYGFKSTDNVTKTLKKTLSSTLDTRSFVGDTIYETNSFSYDTFIEKNIFKEEKFVGLIEKPITESELFIERDEFTIFERHQRLSEINNLATLENYRGGYYKNIKTL